MHELGRKAVEAARVLALAPTASKNAALVAAAAALRAQQSSILEANAHDVGAARAEGMSAALLDRLSLDAERIATMARALEEIASVADPIGVIQAAWQRPNGLAIERVVVP